VEVPLFVDSHCIDGEVATCKVIFESNRCIGLENKAMVAAPRLALGSRKGKFLVCLGMKKYREITANGSKASIDHGLRRGTDNEKIQVTAGSIKERVANGAAHAKQADVDRQGRRCRGIPLGCECLEPINSQWRPRAQSLIIRRVRRLSNRLRDEWSWSMIGAMA